MVNINKALICGVIFCVVMTGCSKSKPMSNSKNELKKVTTLQHASKTNENNQYKYFELPEKIILINNGKIVKTITKDDNLYNKVLDLTSRRFKDRIDSILCTTQPEQLNSLESKELVLEFIYSEPKQTKYNQLVPSIKKYTRLLIPLTGTHHDYFYFDDGKSILPPPIVNLLPPIALINLLK